ncbi:hypothetical protein [Spartinivicinus poritis]|uniref:Uncharacterized protein n=1 Tax=Spartinivicinus poritis TaxID=2994640 RepID=A0ABT5UK15_9GAMM|nr:hypothetical protein [Spartinivicinus sp. A2-2]MDE1465852.1 hypothetical protein [Spartinivicinus sp. A2-2]
MGPAVGAGTVLAGGVLAGSGINQLIKLDRDHPRYKYQLASGISNTINGLWTMAAGVAGILAALPVPLVAQAVAAVIGVVAAISSLISGPIISAVETVEIVDKFLDLNDWSRFKLGIRAFFSSLAGSRDEWVESMQHRAGLANMEQEAMRQELEIALLTLGSGGNIRSVGMGGSLFPTTKYRIQACNPRFGTPVNRTPVHLDTCVNLEGPPYTAVAMQSREDRPLGAAVEYLRAHSDEIREIIITMNTDINPKKIIYLAPQGSPWLGSDVEGAKDKVVVGEGRSERTESNIDEVAMPPRNRDMVIKEDEVGGTTIRYIWKSGGSIIKSEETAGGTVSTTKLGWVYKSGTATGGAGTYHLNLTVDQETWTAGPHGALNIVELGRGRDSWNKGSEDGTHIVVARGGGKFLMGGRNGITKFLFEEITHPNALKHEGFALPSGDLWGAEGTGVSYSRTGTQGSPIVRASDWVRLWDPQIITVSGIHPEDQLYILDPLMIGSKYANNVVLKIKEKAHKMLLVFAFNKSQNTFSATDDEAIMTLTNFTMDKVKRIDSKNQLIREA